MYEVGSFVLLISLFVLTETSTDDKGITTTGTPCNSRLTVRKETMVICDNRMTVHLQEPDIARMVKHRYSWRQTKGDSRTQKLQSLRTQKPSVTNNSTMLT